MFSSSGLISVGHITAATVSGRGFTPEELAENALARIISVGKESHPAIREQAEAFKDYIRNVLVSYGNQCVKSNHTTIANRLRDAGHPELIKLLEN